MANVTLVTAEGNSTIYKRTILVPFYYNGVIYVSQTLYLSGFEVVQLCPYMAPFEGVVTLATVSWYLYYKPYYIRVFVNDVLQESILTTQAGETIPFSVNVSAGDTLGVRVVGIQPWVPFNMGVYVGLILEEV